MSREEITAMVNVIADKMTVLRHADPADKAALYAQLGLRLTYDPTASPAHSKRPSRNRAIMYGRVVSEVRVGSYIHTGAHR
jgi:hypothetical protein